MPIRVIKGSCLMVSGSHTKVGTDMGATWVLQQGRSFCLHVALLSNEGQYDALHAGCSLHRYDVFSSNVCRSFVARLAVVLG